MYAKIKSFASLHRTSCFPLYSTLIIPMFLIFLNLYYITGMIINGTTVGDILLLRRALALWPLLNSVKLKNDGIISGRNFLVKPSDLDM